MCGLLNGGVVVTCDAMRIGVAVALSVVCVVNVAGRFGVARCNEAW